MTLGQRDVSMNNLEGTKTICNMRIVGYSPIELEEERKLRNMSR